MKELYKMTPFRKKLKPLKDHPYLTNLKESNSLVRVRYVDGVNQKNEMFEARSLFEELEEEYNIAIPHFEIVYGFYTPESIPVAYYVTEKIQGRLLADAKVPENEVRSLFNSLLDYYQDKHKNGGNFLSDINVDQFMYGRTKSYSGKKIYLVDLDPFYGYFDNTNPGDRNEDFSTSLYLLADLLIILERGKRIDLTEEKVKLLNFLKEIIGCLHPEDQHTINQILGTLPYISY